MAPSSGYKAIAKFGPFEFNVEEGRLVRLGVPRRIENLSALALTHLLQNQDRLVQRTELIALLWPDQEHGDFEHRLDKVIAKLRSSLLETASEPQFIETLRGRGFRFIAPVTWQTPHSESTPPAIDRPPLPAPAHPFQNYPIPEHANPATPPPASRPWFRPLGYAFIAITIGIALLLTLTHRASTQKQKNVAAATTPTVVVLGMRPVEDTAQVDWISRATAMWLAENIQTHTPLHVLTGHDLEDLQSTIPVASKTGLPQRTLTDVAHRTSANFVIFGTYAVQDKESVPAWQLDLWIQDTHHPGSQQEVSIVGPQTDGPALIAKAQRLLCEKIGIAATEDNNPSLFQAPLPTNSAAARLYAEGMLARQRFDLVEASALLRQSSELEPEHSYTHSLLASVLTLLGDQQTATQEYDLAMRNAAQMTPRQQAELWALRCSIAGDWSTAANVYTQLLHDQPTNEEYAIQAASAQINAGRFAAALTTLGPFAGVPGTSPGWFEAQAYLTASLADEGMGNFTRQLDDATHASASAKVSAQSLLVAQAMTQAGAAQFTLGHWDAATAQWKEAQSIYQSLGDRRGMARVLYQQGRLEWAERQPVEARNSLQRAIDMNKSTDNDPTLAAAYAQLGVVLLYNSAKPTEGVAEVSPLFQKAGDIYEHAGNIAGQGRVLGLVGDMEMCESHYAKARDTYARALELSKTAGDKSNIAGRYLDLGIVASEVADNDAAATFYSQAVATFQEIGQRDRAALSQNRLANLLFREGEVDRAIALSSDALQTMRSIGIEDNGIIEDLSRFLAEKDPARAESLATESLNASTDKTDPRELGWRYMVLAEAQMAGGKLHEAKSSIDHAFDLKPVIEHKVMASEMLWARGEINRRLGNLPLAQKDFQAALAIALEFGSKRYEMPARLSLAELDMQIRSPKANSALQEVEADSQKIGYLLIARKAKSDLQGMTPAA